VICTTAGKVRLTPTPLADLAIVNIDYFEDDRGFFIESWNKKDFAAAGLLCDFVQDSHSCSRVGVIRGLHYQDMTAPAAKLVRCTAGRILDVAVDLRAGSSTFGKWFGIELTAKNKALLYVPAGFAHGFAALSDYCEVQYKQAEYYRPEAEGGIAWIDPDIGVQWPFEDPTLSSKDLRQMSLREYLKHPAFRSD